MPFDGSEPAREPDTTAVFRKRREGAIAIWREHGPEIHMADFTCCALAILGERKFEGWRKPFFPELDGMPWAHPCMSAAWFFGLTFQESHELFGRQEPAIVSPDYLAMRLRDLPYAETPMPKLRSLPIGVRDLAYISGLALLT